MNYKGYTVSSNLMMKLGSSKGKEWGYATLFQGEPVDVLEKAMDKSGDFYLFWCTERE